MDERTCLLLATIPPGGWSETITRMEAVRRYLAGGDRTATAVDRHAAEIGVRRSLFYRLVKLYAAIDLEDAAEATPRYRNSVIDPGTERAVQDAIRDLGPSASLAATVERARALCRDRGVPLATSQIVRTRRGRAGAGRAIGQRVRLATDFAFDRSALELAVPDDAGRPCRAVLSCIVDMHEGIVATHVLTAGEPDEADLSAMFADWPDPKGTLSIAQADRDVYGVDLADLARDRGVLPLFYDRRRTGSIVRAAVGTRIGRIDLVERRPAPRHVDIDVETARSVVARLIRSGTAAR